MDNIGLGGRSQKTKQCYRNGLQKALEEFRRLSRFQKTQKSLEDLRKGFRRLWRDSGGDSEGAFLFWAFPFLFFMSPLYLKTLLCNLLCNHKLLSFFGTNWLVQNAKIDILKKLFYILNFWIYFLENTMLEFFSRKKLKGTKC